MTVVAWSAGIRRYPSRLTSTKIVWQTAAVSARATPIPSSSTPADGSSCEATTATMPPSARARASHLTRSSCSRPDAMSSVAIIAG